MDIFQIKSFSKFVAEWSAFLQKTSQVARNHKRCLESNEILGVYLVIQKYGKEPTWKDFYDHLLFLKSVDVTKEIDDYEVHNYKMFISRYIKKLVDKGLLKEIENVFDRRTKKFQVTPLMEQIINEVIEAIDLKK